MSPLDKLSLPVTPAPRKLKKQRLTSLRYRDRAKRKTGSGMVVHAFHTNTPEQEYQVDTGEFKTKLVYIVSSRAARLQGTPCLKTGNVVQLGEHYLECMKPWVP